MLRKQSSSAHAGVVVIPVVFAALAATPVTPAVAADSILVGAGDIHADCLRTGNVATAAIVSKVPGIVFTLGDNADTGAIQEYTDCYERSWGAFKNRTMPVSGDNDWETAGAAGYFAYFGAAAGDPVTALYSYDVDDAWHVVVLNSECANLGVGCSAGSPQDLWLRADLEASAGRNVVAMWHRPAFASQGGGYAAIRPLFSTLYRYGVDLLLSAHVHEYERFAPQTVDRIADPKNGVRQFIVGTAGGEQSPCLEATTKSKNSLARKSCVLGALKLTLHSDSYDWKFMPVAGQTFADSGTAPVNKGPTAPFGYDQDVLVKADTAASVTLHAIDMQKNPLSYRVVSAPAHGALSGVKPRLTYTPDTGYRGDDVFAFRANDGVEDSNPVVVRLTVAAPQSVTVQDSVFSPSSPTPAQGATVRWSFTGTSTHTVQDSQSLGLFNSGSKAPGAVFSYAFGAAGTYAYACSVHPTQKGTIRIPLKVAAKAAKGASLPVTWASAQLNGYVYDVQVLKPGATAWTSWITDSYGLRANYTPALAGTYGFRARLQRISNGKVSGWSPVSSVSIY